ncbi:TonB-dependent receptor [Noviherbaspirillum galbum]|uniref:TonB-dependent receptor n=1 Tax=Noviherbaspirillum galbum TaxID=2709383 RepID=A0A6B3SP44_9BURK|nr:TonB-dependent receptor [Noviherbaspirillum galbum]NEX61065.1 TonB-dependent receptor [Noviherbaspirillum galbum]
MTPAAIAAIATAGATPLAALAEELSARPALPAIVVVSSTPLPGLGMPREQVPGNVQTLGRTIMDDPGSANLPDLLNRRIASVMINEIQGNPYQPDVSYRGFIASPLLGTPQGLSVYMDGVRLNQPFGDVVSWDLIPRSAIASITLMPGSNPLFGLNTLGGALAIQTKDGRLNAGTAVQGLAGSFGRQSLEFEHGGHDDLGLHWFVAGNVFKDGGWREESPSRVGQLFGKLGWAGDNTDLALTLAAANTALTGNGMQEKRLLDRDYHSVYTKPDETRNRSLFVNLAAEHGLSDGLQFAGNAYYRRIRTSTLNGDLNEDSLDQSVYQASAAERAALAGAGYAGVPSSGANASNTPFPYLRCIANVLRSDEPAEKCNGLINRTASTQENAGIGGQFTLTGRLGGHKNQFIAGAGFDASRIAFGQTTQFGYLTPDHGIQPVNFFADGTEVGDDGRPVDSRVDLIGRTRTWSLYASDTLHVGDALQLTLSGRYNRTAIRNADQIHPGGGKGSLDGDHRFGRFNPAAGATWTLSPAVNLYLGYNEGSRTPTAIELGCADPDNPCKLPNAMAGDPPLKQVVTKTWEAGMRGRLGGKMRWNAGLFRADNIDDILFVADNAAGFGYFRNVGRTRRQGLELGWEGDVGPVGLSANYTYLDATFQSNELLNGSANSSKDADGRIAIRPGDRLPLIPSHLFKARATWQASSAWQWELGMLAVSGSNARGNENGAHQPDGKVFLGSGRSPGYAIFDLGAKYRANTAWTFFAQVNNLLDRQYSTAAQLGVAGFTGSGSFIARPFSGSGDNATLVSSTFHAPGAPRTAWIGARYTFGN